LICFGCVGRRIAARLIREFEAAPMRIGYQLNSECSMFSRVKVFVQVRGEFRPAVIAIGHLQGIQQGFAAKVRTVSIQLIQVDLPSASLVSQAKVDVSKPSASLTQKFGRLRGTQEILKAFLRE